MQPRCRVTQPWKPQTSAYRALKVAIDSLRTITPSQQQVYDMEFARLPEVISEITRKRVYFR